MGGPFRYWLCGGVLLLLALLYGFRPRQETLLQIQGPDLLNQELEAALGDFEGQLGQAEKEGKPVPDANARMPLRIAKLPDGLSKEQAAGFRKLLEATVERTRKPQGSAPEAEPTPYLQPALAMGPPGLTLSLRFDPDQGRFTLEARCPAEPFTSNQPFEKKEVRYLASFSSLIPAFLVLFLAIFTGRTIPSLLAGVLLGVVMFRGPLMGLWYFFHDYLIQRILLDNFQLQVLGFVMLLSAAIGLMTRTGGIEGLVDLVRKFARTARSSQLVTWIMGHLIFFDDYANAIIVGSTMRPLTDRLKVSREKLAYIVDATAAPVAGLVPLSTWVAVEISYFQSQLGLVEAPDGSSLEGKGFFVFLQTMPYRFYCILTLFMVLMTIVLKREFGPMLRAERRARHEDKPLHDDARPMVKISEELAATKAGVQPDWKAGFFPILALVLVTIGLIVYTGFEGLESGYWQTLGAHRGWFENLTAVIGAANSAWAIFWGSFTAVLIASLIAIGRRILSPREAIATTVRSMGTLGFAVAILVLAWCIGFVCADLGTRHYLSAMASAGKDLYWLLPSLLFVISCIVAFATGSSWATMAILLPNVVLMANNLGQGTDIGGYGLVILSIGAVMEGAIFGDHCSPISDTTVLSSVATCSDHLHHVQTQAPYALLVMLTALTLGYLPVAAFGLSPWLSMAFGALTIVLFLLIIGRDPEAAV